ncbi:MAG TPA: hypothetical protein VGN57_08390 [Pirellulaceae bacterium]|jgi:hypothetical protein|nr:hypothetical protein [Pirellulaceae bacterium]
MTIDSHAEGAQRLLHFRDGSWRTVGWLAEPVRWQPKYDWLPWRVDGQGDACGPAAWILAGAALEWSAPLARWDAEELVALRTVAGFRSDGTLPDGLLGKLFVPGVQTWRVAVQGDRLRRTLAASLLIGPGDVSPSRRAGTLTLAWRSPVDPATGRFWQEEAIEA